MPIYGLCLRLMMNRLARTSRAGTVSPARRQSPQKRSTLKPVRQDGKTRGYVCRTKIITAVDDGGFGVQGSNIARERIVAIIADRLHEPGQSDGEQRRTAHRAVEYLQCGGFGLGDYTDLVSCVDQPCDMIV